jgi:hypothetical protein
LKLRRQSQSPLLVDLSFDYDFCEAIVAVAISGYTLPLYFGGFGDHLVNGFDAVNGHFFFL